MKKSVLVAAGLLTASLFAASAVNAAPLGGIATGSSAIETDLVQKVHDGNIHRVCLLGPGGWHYHSRFSHRRIACRPASPGRLWIWRSEGGRVGWWNRNEKRWHDN